MKQYELYYKTVWFHGIEITQFGINILFFAEKHWYVLSVNSTKNILNEKKIVKNSC